MVYPGAGEIYTCGLGSWLEFYTKKNGNHERKR